MAFHFNPETRINSIPVRELVAYVADLPAISVQDAETPHRSKLFETAIDAGFITRSGSSGQEVTRTDLGFAFKNSMFTMRKTLSEAEVEFRGLLDRIEKINEEKKIRIPHFWLYGSFFRRDRMIGDIDLVLDWERPQGLEPEPFVDALRADLSKEVRFAGGRSDVVEEWLRREVLLGDSFLSASFDSFDLRSLAPPCALWSGGIVTNYPDGPPNAIPSRNSPASFMSIETDIGVFRNRIPPDTVLNGALRNAVTDLLADPGPARFGSFFRDMELRYGRDPDEPAAQALWNNVLLPREEEIVFLEEISFSERDRDFLKGFLGAESESTLSL